MKPRTQIQKQADELSKTLRPLPRYIIDKFCQHTEQNNRKRYYAVLEQKQEFTVLRYFSFIKHKKIDNVCEEFMQVWMNKHGNAVRAKQRFSMGHYFDTFIKDSPIYGNSHEQEELWLQPPYRHIFRQTFYPQQEGAAHNLQLQRKTILHDWQALCVAHG